MTMTTKRMMKEKTRCLWIEIRLHWIDLHTDGMKTYIGYTVLINESILLPTSLVYIMTELHSS